MAKYEVRFFNVPTEIIVTVDADDEEIAVKRARSLADEYAQTGNHRQVRHVIKVAS